MKSAKKKNHSAQGKKACLQFIIQRLEKFGSLPLSHLTGHLSQLPSDVRKCLGTSLPEVKIFLRKYTSIFDVDHNDVVHLLLQHPKENPNGKLNNKNQCSPTSSFTDPNPGEVKNGKGRVQQLFSQTGFIQASEPLEAPVYFTVQNFGDKNKQLLQDFGLKEGAILHFSAIKEPPGSLTRYRATQVWFPKKNTVKSVEGSPQLQQIKKVADHGVTENKSEGKIQHVFDKFGFITSESTGKNSVFFHKRSIVNAPAVSTNLKEILKEGDDVEYCSVKSVKTDSLAPWEATYVFLKKYEDVVDVSDDEIFMSSSESSTLQSDIGSSKALEMVSTEKLINSETVQELGPRSKLGSLSPRIPAKLNISLAKEYFFTGRLYIRSDDDAIIISTKRRSCDIAVVDTKALFYISGRKVARISAFQDGQTVWFRAKKDEESHKWVAILVFVGDKPNEDRIENDTARNVKDNLGTSCDASNKKELLGNGAIDLDRTQVPPVLDNLTAEHPVCCRDFAGNQKSIEEDGDGGFKNYMEFDCVDKGHFIQERNGFCKDNRECTTQQSNETLFKDECVHVGENARMSVDAEHQNEVDGSLETGAQVCEILANKNCDMSNAGERANLSDSEDMFFKPTACVHKYERCKTDKDCQFCVKQNMNSPYQELYNVVDCGCQNVTVKTCCQISNSNIKVQQRDFSVCNKKSDAQSIVGQCPREFVGEKFQETTCKESHHEEVTLCGNCGTQQKLFEECTDFEGEIVKPPQRCASVPEHFFPKKIAHSVMDRGSELNLLEELQSVKNRLHKFENLILSMKKNTKMPSPCISYQDKVNMDIHHVSSRTVHGILHSDCCGNSFCSNCKGTSHNEKPLPAFKDYGCQANLITSNVIKPAAQTKGVQTYSTGNILYADIFPR